MDGWTDEEWVKDKWWDVSSLSPGTRLFSTAWRPKRWRREFDHVSQSQNFKSGESEDQNR